MFTRRIIKASQWSINALYIKCMQTQKGLETLKPVKEKRKRKEAFDLFPSIMKSFSHLLLCREPTLWKALKYDLSPCAFRGRMKDEHIENVIIDFIALGNNRKSSWRVHWVGEECIERWKRMIKRGKWSLNFEFEKA